MILTLTLAIMSTENNYDSFQRVFISWILFLLNFMFYFFWAIFYLNILINSLKNKKFWRKILANKRITFIRGKIGKMISKMFSKSNTKIQSKNELFQRVNVHSKSEFKGYTQKQTLWEKD